MPRSLIAVTASRYSDERHSAHRGYADAVFAVGGAPLLVPSVGSVGTADWVLDVLDGCAGVVLTGGGDVGPATTGVDPHEHLMELDPVRDAVEVAMLRWAVDSGVPVLGICRGIQLLAAALGGTLVPDLPSAGHPGHWDEARQHEPVHAVEVKPGSLAARALDGEQLVNSIHHQAVADPGPLLEATAWSDDGVIEAVEGDRLLGVQWHPERLIAARPVHLAPFAWLVDR